MATDNTASMSPVPQAVVQSTPAPGLRGPVGLSPRQNYSRVNTGVPGDVDAGALQQKSIMPKVGSIMSTQISARPRALNDMLKTAMESTLSRTKIAAEAKRQLETLEGSTKEASAQEQPTSDGLETEFVLKLAEAAEFIASELSKEGADLAGGYTLKETTTGAGLGPNALTVTHTMPEGPPHVIHTNSGQAATNKPPMNPGVQKAHPQEHGATQMENDKDRAPGAGDAPNSGSTKNAAPIDLLRKMAAQQKVAEDAINPAHISAGKAVPPDVSVTGTPGPAASGKERVPATAQGVADLTRREAKSVPKKEMASVFDEKMMSAAHDNVLQQAFTHTNEAGAKVSSAQRHQVKLAAAQMLLTNLISGGK